MQQRQNPQADQLGPVGPNGFLSKCFVFRHTPRYKIDQFLPPNIIQPSTKGKDKSQVMCLAFELCFLAS